MYCAAPILAGVYSGRDNVISLVLVADGAVLSDLSGVTRVTVDLDSGTTVIDSDIAGSSVIWWTDSEAHRGETVDVLRMALGSEAIAAGTYDDVEIVVYDATYPDGLRVENDIRLTVHA